MLIGRTGAGKASAANVLCGHDVLDAIANPNLPFKIGSGSVSMTRDGSAHTHDAGSFDVTVVDTLGIGDTNLSEQEVLFKLVQAITHCRGTLNQLAPRGGGGGCVRPSHFLLSRRREVHDVCAHVLPALRERRALLSRPGMPGVRVTRRPAGRG